MSSTHLRAGQKKSSKTLSSLLGAWLFLVPLDYIFIIKYGLVSPSHIVAILIFLYGIVNAQSLTFSAQKFSLVFAAFSVVAFLGNVASVNLAMSMVATGTLLYYFGLSVVIYYFCARDTSKVTYVLSAFLAGCFVAGLYAISFNHGTAQRLAIVEGANPTWLGAYQVAGIYCAGFLMLYGGKVRSIILWLVIGFLAYVLIRSQSQTAMYSMAAAYCYYIFRTSKDRFWLALCLLAIFFIAVFMFVGNVENMELRNFERTFACSECTYTEVGSGRPYIWKSYLEQDIYRLVGVGLQNAQHYYSPHAPHNTFITVLAECGLLGLILSLLALGVSLYRVFPYKYASFGVLFFVFFMFGNDMIYYKYAWVIINSVLLVGLKERAIATRSLGV